MLQYFFRNTTLESEPHKCAVSHDNNATTEADLISHARPIGHRPLLVPYKIDNTTGEPTYTIGSIIEPNRCTLDDPSLTVLSTQKHSGKPTMAVLPLSQTRSTQTIETAMIVSTGNVDVDDEADVVKDMEEAYKPQHSFNINDMWPLEDRLRSSYHIGRCCTRGDSSQRRIEVLMEELASAKQSLDSQIRHNTDLKRMLMAAVGPDLATSMERLSKDKTYLQQEVKAQRMRIHLMEDEADAAAIQVDVWRSKYMAGRLMLEEFMLPMATSRANGNPSSLHTKDEEVTYGDGEREIENDEGMSMMTTVATAQELFDLTTSNADDRLSLHSDDQSPQLRGQSSGGGRHCGRQVSAKEARQDWCCLKEAGESHLPMSQRHRHQSTAA